MESCFVDTQSQSQFSLGDINTATDRFTDDEDDDNEGMITHMPSKISQKVFPTNCA